MFVLFLLLKWNENEHYTKLWNPRGERTLWYSFIWVEIFIIVNYCILNGKYYITRHHLFHNNAKTTMTKFWELEYKLQVKRNGNQEYFSIDYLFLTHIVMLFFKIKNDLQKINPNWASETCLPISPIWAPDITNMLVTNRIQSSYPKTNPHQTQQISCCASGCSCHLIGCPIYI